MLDRVRARAGRVALVVLGVLIVHNLAWAVRNQLRLPRSQRPHPSSRRLSEVALASPHPAVHGRIAIFYLLAERVSGGNLTVPARHANLQWMLERVGRQHVRISEAALVLPAAREQAVRDAGVHRRLGVGRGRYRDVYLLLDDASRDHVLATSSTGDDLFVVPAALLAEPAP